MIVGVSQFGSASGQFSGDPKPKIGLLGQFGILGNSGLEIPDQPFGVVGCTNEAGTGVLGASPKGMGVHGVNDAPQGSSLKPDYGCGIWGESSNGYGVFGSSDNNAGIKGVSTNNVGVLGQSVNGLAGQFFGNVEVLGNITIRNDGDVILADCAEEFQLLPSTVNASEPGSVMVLDETGTIRPCAKAYDKRAIGVISGAGQFRPAIVLDRAESVTERVPIAIIGKVCCKVDATFAPVEVGDLLTTSSTLGYAMKAENALKAFGAVIGKALEPLAEGQGLIPILVTLL